MKTAYIFHDAFADQYADWYPWLKGVLEGFGYKTIAPTFPTPAGQTLASWCAVMKNFIPTFDQETIFIGHGTGALFALRMVEESEKQIKGLFLVAGYAEKIGHAGFDRVNETFFQGDFKWETIKSRAVTVRVFAGQNDPYVPQEVVERLAKNLGVIAEIIPGGEHFNKVSGYTQFVPLADAIRVGEMVIAQGVVQDQDSETVPVPAQPLPIVEPKSSQVAPSDIIPQQTSPSIHTMYQDMGVLVNSNKGSVASSLLAKAREDEVVKKEVSPTSPKNMLYFFGTLIAIIIAVGVLGYTWRTFAPIAKNPTAKEIPSLIRAETHHNIDIANREPYVVLTDIRSALATNTFSGTIRDIYYTQGQTRAPFVDVLRALEITTIPDRLKDDFQDMFMHGVGQIGGKEAHFLVLPVTNYDESFAGMRLWEQTLFRDVGVFMNVPNDYLRVKMDKDSFADETVANRNLRVLRYVKPAEISFEEEPPGVSGSPDSEVVENTDSDDDSTGVTTSTESVESTETLVNFVSEGLGVIQSNNPFANVSSPYQEGDIMLAYFFLTEKTIVIVDNVDIIPELLARFANRQIYSE